jgi:hypothetical protein
MKLTNKQREIMISSLYHSQKRYTVGDRFWEDYQEIIDVVKNNNESN